MLGEELTSEVTKREVLGDRACALVDSADRKVASAIGIARCAGGHS